MIGFFKKHFSRMGLLAFSVDTLILLFTATLALIITIERGSPHLVRLEHIPLIVIYLLTFVLMSQTILFINELYITEKRYQKKILVSKCIVSFLIVSLACYLQSQRVLSHFNYFLLSMASCSLILCWRFVFYWIVRKVNIQHKVLFFGTDELSQKVVREILADDHPKYKVAGFIGNDPSLVGKSLVNPKVIGLPADLGHIIGRERIKKIVVSCPEGRGSFPTEDLVACKFKGIQILELHTFYEHLKGKILLHGLRPSWLIFTDGFKKAKTFLWLKRGFDVVASVVGLLMTLPVFLIVSIAIKFDSEGPVIYKQERVGEKGRLFNLYKFRSMRTDAEKYSGPVWAQENDPRITRVGKFIRKLRIDEIPQMVNVLKGDMSFVGPRPERPSFVGELKRRIPYYDQRHSVKPGITGWAAVNFSYGASVEDALEKLQYDLYYIKNMSFFLDALVFLKTFTVIIGRRGSR